MNKTAIIKKMPNGKYRVMSEDYERNFGEYNTRGEAEKRLKQIDYFKYLDGQKNKRKKKALDLLSEAAKFAFDSDIRQGILLAISAIDDLEEPRSDLTYTSVMRELRQKESEDKIKNFMKEFKEAFDAGLYEGIDEPESAALMMAIKKTEVDI